MLSNKQMKTKESICRLSSLEEVEKGNGLNIESKKTLIGIKNKNFIIDLSPEGFIEKHKNGLNIKITDMELTGKQINPYNSKDISYILHLQEFSIEDKSKLLLYVIYSPRLSSFHEGSETLVISVGKRKNIDDYKYILNVKKLATYVNDFGVIMLNNNPVKFKKELIELMELTHLSTATITKIFKEIENKYIIKDNGFWYLNPYLIKYKKTSLFAFNNQEFKKYKEEKQVNPYIELLVSIINSEPNFFKEIKKYYYSLSKKFEQQKIIS